MDSIKKVENLIAQWVHDKGIYASKDLYKQALKCNEEIGEATGDILKGRDPRMELGDIFVTLVAQATVVDMELISIPSYDITSTREVEQYNNNELLGYMILEIAMIMNDISNSCYDKYTVHANLHRAYILLDVLCGRVGTTLLECSIMAYEKISGRTGAMKDGVFVAS